MVYVKKTLPYSAFAAGATSSDVTILTTTAECLVTRPILVVDTDFAGGSVNACNVSIGPAAAETALLANTDVFTGVNNGFANATVSNTAAKAVAKGVAIVARMNASHNTNTLNAGMLTVWVDVRSLEKSQL